MEYKRIGDSYFGFAKLYITEVAESYPDFFSGFSLFITCLDSNNELSQLPKWQEYVRSKNWNSKMIGQSYWIPAENVREIFNDGKTFFHFDETYLLLEQPEDDFDHEQYFTTDGLQFNQEVPAEFAQKFKDLKAVRYLSDGCGLNFACESLEIVKRIEEIERLYSEKNW